MNYNKKTGEFVLSAYEATVTVFYRTHPSIGEHTALFLSPSNTLKLYDLYPFGDMAFSLCADVFSVEEDTLSVYFLLPSGEQPSKKDKRLARGYAFLAGKMLLSSTHARTLTLVLTYTNSDGEILARDTEKVTPLALSRFARRLFDDFIYMAKEEIHRTTCRLPTLALLSFPFTDVRAGQKELMGSVHRAIKQGKSLFAQAPTGVGKTAAVLFPALRAIGEGLCRRAFYFTPKDTTAKTALDTLNHFAKAGAKVQGMKITAKEKICKQGGKDGDCTNCPYHQNNHTTHSHTAHNPNTHNPNTHNHNTNNHDSNNHSKSNHNKNNPNSIDIAVNLLLEERRAVITSEDFVRVSLKSGACPYEVSLTYAYFADVIVCDYNYLLAPNARLQRFFSTSTDAVFLFDEAHNLPDRVRAMHSATLDDAFFAETIGTLSLSPAFSETKRLFEEARAVFSATLENMLKAERYLRSDGTPVSFAQTDRPDKVLHACIKKAHTAQKELLSTTPSLEQADRQKLWDASQKLATILSTSHTLFARLSMGGGTAKSVIFAEQDGDKRALHFLCLDPQDDMAEAVALGKASVFFSATLSPLSYYKDALLGQNIADVVNMPSPYTKDNCCIAVLDGVRTNYASREDSKDDIVRIILETMRAKKGNYMVFFPSFAYMEKVYARFVAVAPKVASASQKRVMTEKERKSFLGHFEENSSRPENEQKHFVGFCVLGGLYAEGVDLVGNRLIGAIIVGVGLPSLSSERELLANYYQNKNEQGKAYAYTYPGMHKVLQAGGRVIRHDDDRGVIVLVDSRFRDRDYQKIIPENWRHLKFVKDTPTLGKYLAHFWEG